MRTLLTLERVLASDQLVVGLDFKVPDVHCVLALALASVLLAVVGDEVADVFVSLGSLGQSDGEDGILLLYLDCELHVVLGLDLVLDSNNDAHGCWLFGDN